LAGFKWAATRAYRLGRVRFHHEDASILWTAAKAIGKISADVLSRSLRGDVGKVEQFFVWHAPNMRLRDRTRQSLPLVR
jgi:hypothetical protein